ncbi:extensin family protein [Thalassovita taeanensis]|uniref:extensin-like domain-containing protein n=1 Tax=Thalassovita taeanensis TaxID=657014 RepID=UPI001FE44FF4|nr:extensin family protein [Thalassovita taeanensis]
MLAIFCALMVAQVASANAPLISLRPVARGEVAASTILSANPEVLGVQKEVATPDRRSVLRFLRPRQRNEAVAQRARQFERDRRRGVVCSDPALKGDPVGLVPGALAGCGLDNAVRLRAVSGVTLSQAAIVDCTTAKALKAWVEKGLKPAVGRRGGGVSEMRVFASYSCRTRNSRKGARISEHGKGRAIDIGGIVLRDGSLITVLDSWGKRKEGKILRKMHKSACGPFGTVLGPASDRFHKDHFHLDTARYRSGPYCR